MSGHRSTDAARPAVHPGRPLAGLVDPAEDGRLARDGFVVLAERLASEQIDELEGLHRWAEAVCGRDETGLFFPSMLMSDPEVRARIWDEVRRVVGPHVDRCFREGAYASMGGLFVTKPPSQSSMRTPHQDPTAFDETNQLGLSVWIPLAPVTRENGTVHLLPGSHRMGNHVRPRDVESLSPQLEEVALRDSVAIDLEAGQMLLIDGAVIHHSPPNRSTQDRIALICTLRPAAAQLLFVLSQRGLPNGIADVHEVTEEMYRSGDVRAPVFDACETVSHRAYRQVGPADLERSLEAG